jgi:hypothetical protein
MFPILFFAQAATAIITADTATYSTAAVRALVVEAAHINHRVPPTLGRYRANLESEISVGTHDGGGSEMAASIEQVASTLTWTRTGEFEQRVVGYRAQALGLELATISFIRNSWAVPSLYGNRLALLFGRDTARGGIAGANARRTTFAVHPLADDRERVYRYSGGDTVESLQVGDRKIRIVHIEVVPKAKVPSRTILFSGEIDLDVDRMNVVRMRGAFASSGEPDSPLSALLGPARLQGIVYVELVNSEVNQQYWLPSYQRFEAQAMAPVIGDAKAVFRIVSRFRDYQISAPDSVTGAASVVREDTLRAQPHILRIADSDSLARFNAWRSDIGTATASATSDDFADVAPARWRTSGSPVITLQTERATDLIRFNRIEGLFTGLGVSARFRDAAPGLTARIVAGYAWNERTVRGRVSAELRRNAWTYAVRVGRSLDITNDFRVPLDSGSSFGALFGFDDYDYVDRYSAGIAATRSIAGNSVRVRLEGGWAQDRNTVALLMRGPIISTHFLPNRGVDAGSYARTAVTVEWHPDAAAEFMRPGTGAALSYLRGDGALNFQRMELRLSARKNKGRWTVASRFDAGALVGDRLPQQLFELGKSPDLAGYRYKEFAGDQAAVLRGLTMYRLNLLTAPIHLTTRLWLPSLSPALFVSAQTGWTGVSDGAARAAILRLGTGMDGSPVSVVTGNARSSVTAGIRFFGGALGIGAARPIDRAGPWRLQIDLGQLF